MVGDVYIYMYKSRPGRDRRHSLLSRSKGGEVGVEQTQVLERGVF
jgi:hypothetical protein